MKKKVYICSPYSAGGGRTVEQNVAIARKLCLYAIAKGYVPIAPHLLYPQVLNDNDPEARALGMECGLALLDACHDIWVYTPSVMSAGMLSELNGLCLKRSYSYDKVVYKNHILDVTFITQPIDELLEAEGIDTIGKYRQPK